MIDLHVQGRQGRAGWKLVAMYYLLPSLPLPLSLPPKSLPCAGPWKLAHGDPSSRLASMDAREPRGADRRRGGGRTGESPADRPARRRRRSQMDRIVFSSPDPILVMDSVSRLMNWRS